MRWLRANDRSNIDGCHFLYVYRVIEYKYSTSSLGLPSCSDIRHNDRCLELGRLDERDTLYRKTSVSYMLTITQTAHLLNAGLKLRDRSLDEGRFVGGDLAEAVDLNNALGL